MARGDKNREAHSERVSETASEKQKEERARERSEDKPDVKGDGKAQPLRTTSKSDLDETIEEKEGRQAMRNPEEMSLHDELSRTKDDEPKSSGSGNRSE